MKDDYGLQIVRITAEDTYKLRHEVLWPDAPLLSVQLATDSTSIHLGAYTKERPDTAAERTLVGVISIHIPEPEAESTSAASLNKRPEAQFRKLAVAPQWQGHGFGSRLVEQAGVVATDADARSLWCDARTSALSFYEKLGMQTEGSSFMRKGVEYVKMRRALA
jgi:ribosomal protein S18 acetylase RimI-like enzyme